MSRRTVPLALRSELEMPMGPLGNFPIRTMILTIIFAVPALLLIFAPFLQLEVRFVAAIILVGIGFAISLPKREGIWIGTFLFYRHLPLANSLGGRGLSTRSKVTWSGNSFVISAARSVTHLPLWRGGLSIPRVADPSVQERDALVGGGLMLLKPGGWRGVLTVEGPTIAMFSPAYEAWQSRFMNWLVSLETPAQVLTVVDHYSSAVAERAFDDRIRAKVLPAAELVHQERELAGELAARSFKLKSYLILNPAGAKVNGTPAGLDLTDFGLQPSTAFAIVREKLNQAQRTAQSFELKVAETPFTEIERLAKMTPLGSATATASERATKVGAAYHVPFAVVGLPRTIAGGDLVDAVMQARSQALISVHLNPVHPSDAKKKITKLMKTRYSASKAATGFDVENPMVMQEGADLLALFAQGERAVVTSTTISLFGPQITEVEEAGDRLAAYLDAKGFISVRPGQPGMLPILAASPGWFPLKRSCLMTTKTAAECLVPIIGTAYGRVTDAVIGINEFTGSPAYWDCWKSQTNHNLLMLGSSGGGKSVSLKVMLYRHWLAGSNFVVIDPDNEYQQLVAATGGEFYQLGEAALNPFSLALSSTAEDAAASIAPLLSVLGGDQTRDDQGRPVRFMEPGDSAWLQTQLYEFFRQIANHQKIGVEPILADFIAWLDRYIASRTKSDSDMERASKIRDRLGFYCQGHNGLIFNRRSTFAIGDRPVAIGLKGVSSEFHVDLTPAMALILTALLRVMDTAKQRLLLVIDEASELTNNPDAGAVVQQIIRRGRKRATGIWMASQNLDDFLGTPLGDVLAKNSSAKWLLGVQENQVEAVKTAFNLSDDEASCLSPIRRGSGLLLTDAGARASVAVIPSPLLLALVGSTPDVVEDDYDGDEGVA